MSIVRVMCIMCIVRVMCIVRIMCAVCIMLVNRVADIEDALDAMRRAPRAN